VWKKTLIRGIQIFSWRVKLNWKIALIKRKKNQKNKGQIKKKIKQQKVWLKVEIESQKNFNKSVKEIFFLKRSELKYKTYEKLQLKDWIEKKIL